MTSSDLANWKLIKNIALEISSRNNGIFSIVEIEELFKERHPDRKSINVPMDSAMITVNSQSRLSYLYIYGKPNKGKKIRNNQLINSSKGYPRISSPNNEKDFMYKLDSGKYEIYEPSKHGVWEIVLGEDDVNRIIKREDKELGVWSKASVTTSTARRQIHSPDKFNSSTIHVERPAETPHSAADIKRAFALKVENAINSPRSERLDRLRHAPKVPIAVSVLSNAFLRNPDVVAEVLLRANGVCERCHCNAPFVRAKDKTPYLEVHHRKRLADGGEDSVENAIALCPNCHRWCHYGGVDG
jgi:hypothetical protein